MSTPTNTSPATAMRAPWWDTVTSMTAEQEAQYTYNGRTREEKIMSNTVASMPVGATGRVLAGKFAGRTFRVREHGTNGVLTLVEWTEHGTRGSIRATTPVEEI